MNSTKNTQNNVLSDKEKKLKHVKIYDQLYEMIQNGTFPAGSQLPSEPELASRMDVSRMTLRRALALLQEDNLVLNIQGKGNFIKEQVSPSSQRTKEEIQHPMLSSRDIRDETELEFRIEPPTDSIRQSLQQDTAAIVIADRWYKRQNKAIGYSLSFVPIEVISEYKIDLSNPDCLTDFLERNIYQVCSYSSCRYTYTNTGNFTALRYTLDSRSKFMLIRETLFDKNEKVLVYSKHYMPLHDFNLEVHRTNGIGL